MTNEVEEMAKILSSENYKEWLDTERGEIMNEEEKIMKKYGLRTDYPIGSQEACEEANKLYELINKKSGEAMTDEIPEMPEELFNMAKDNLKKISSLVEKLNLDLHGGNSIRKAAAAIIIHILIYAINNDEVMEEGNINELGTLENPLPAKEYKKAKTVYLSKEEDKEND